MPSNFSATAANPVRFLLDESADNVRLGFEARGFKGVPNFDFLGGGGFEGSDASEENPTYPPPSDGARLTGTPEDVPFGTRFRPLMPSMRISKRDFAMLRA